MAAVLLHSPFHALHTVAMHLTISFRRHRQPTVKIDRIHTVIFNAYQQETVLRVDIHFDQACFRIAVFLLTLDGVVNGVAEDRTNVHRVHEVRRLRVRLLPGSQVMVMLFSLQTIFLLVNSVSSTEEPVLTSASYT